MEGVTAWELQSRAKDIKSKDEAVHTLLMSDVIHTCLGSLPPLPSPGAALEEDGGLCTRSRTSSVHPGRMNP